MIDLRNYLFKDVVLIDIDNKRWEGHVFSFHDAEDNDDNEYSITCLLYTSDAADD